MSKRIEKPVRNNPGIYREFKFDPVTGKWKETGKLRAIRRVIENGRSKKEQAVFDNIEDAKKYRAGMLAKPGSHLVHRLEVGDPSNRYTFGRLVEDWKSLHYLQIEFTSRQQYESRLPHLTYLWNLDVPEITTEVITKLIQQWASPEYPKPRDRQKFEKELDLLKIILNFYRRHKNHAYFVPILPEHYRAADLVKKARGPVKGLREEDIPRFLNALNERYPQFYVIALTQLGLGLRIGEALGLRWEDFDLDRHYALIQRNVAWDKENQKLLTKKRKNAKALEVAIPGFLEGALRNLRATQETGTQFLFERKGDFIRRQQVSKAYNRILVRLGIPNLSGTHFLRKTSGTLARKLTGDVYAASKLLDHSSVSITEKYYQEELDEDKIRVASALDSVLSRVGSNGNTPQGGSPVPQCPANPTRPKLKLVKSDS